MFVVRKILPCCFPSKEELSSKSTGNAEEQRVLFPKAPSPGRFEKEHDDVPTSQLTPPHNPLNPEFPQIASNNDSWFSILDTSHINSSVTSEGNTSIMREPCGLGGGGPKNLPLNIVSSNSSRSDSENEFPDNSVVHSSGHGSDNESTGNSSINYSSLGSSSSTKVFDIDD